MAFAKESEALEQAISGFGVDEKSVLEIFKGLKIEDIRSFRTSTPEIIVVDGVCRFKTIADCDAERMRTCFLHFPKAVEMWKKHPYERDACLMRSAFEGEEVLPKKILVEVICTRAPAQLVGAKMVYQQLYNITIEEQLKTYIPQTLELKLLTALLVGDHENERNAKEVEDLQTNVKMLFQTLRHAGENRALELITNETIYYIDMLLREQYQMLTNTSFKENVGNYEIMKVILKCRRDAVSYFLEVVEDAFEANDADALTRVIVTRADNDMTEIKKAFLAKHNMSLQQKIKDVAKGRYKDFILSLMARSADD